MVQYATQRESEKERVPWTSRRSNQSILKEVNPDYSLEGLILKWKLQYCGHLMWRTDSLEKTLMLGKIEGRNRRGQGWDGWMASPIQWTWVWANSRRQWRTRNLEWSPKESDTTGRLNNSSSSYLGLNISPRMNLWSTTPWMNLWSTPTTLLHMLSSPFSLMVTSSFDFYHQDFTL